jgi:tetratricopeptide (TPR) repeat protein
MKKANWSKFPYPDKAYQYAGAALKKAWPRLHRGDCEPFPDDASLQDAWRAYHAGDFGKAVELGLKAGVPGYNVANKAAMIYANYLEEDEERKLALFQEIAARSEELQAAEPGNANAWYFHAYALGRYSQGISGAKALAEGLGGRIKQSLGKAIALAPKHADAHIALGTWHAEVIDKVGSLVGGLTYGAKKDLGAEHFAEALKLNPDSAIARFECANGLVMMFGKAKMKEAEKLYAEAVGQAPADAMERLDIELVRTELED